MYYKHKKLNYKKLFIIFLKKRRLYSEYISEYPNNILDTFSPFSYVSGSFSWIKTKKGYTFWNNIHIEWRGIVEDIRFLDNLNLGLLKAFNLHKKVESYSSLSRINSFYDVSDFISVAFGWSESKEGYDYWLKAAKELDSFEV